MIGIQGKIFPAVRPGLAESFGPSLHSRNVCHFVREWSLVDIILACMCGTRIVACKLLAIGRAWPGRLHAGTESLVWTTMFLTLVSNEGLSEDSDEEREWMGRGKEGKSLRGWPRAKLFPLSFKLNLATFPI